MYRNTLFGELLKGLPRSTFEKIVRDEQGDKYSKGFRCWDQLTAMVFGQLSQCQSLREMEAAFNSHSMYHYHLGTRSIKRSTLAEANAKRSATIYERLCQHLMQTVSRSVREELSSLLYLIDSSPIYMKPKVAESWGIGYRNNITQGLKLHLMMEANTTLPVYLQLTGAGTSDVKVGRTIEPEPNATYVFDRGYYDFNWWFQIHEVGSHFVTRLKKNAAIRLEETLPVPAEDQGYILEDSKVIFTSMYTRSNTCRNPYYGKPVRRIIVNHPDKKTPLILATNDFERSAAEIAALYKKRWDIELFFKWIKQNLKVKRFIGNNENAVRIQLYIAIITYLLVYLHKRRRQSSLSPKLYVCAIKQALFQRPETDYAIAKRRRQREKEMLARQGTLLL